MYIRRKVFSVVEDKSNEIPWMEEQREYASVRKTKKALNMATKGLKNLVNENPGLTKKELLPILQKNKPLAKNVKFLESVDKSKGAKKFVEAVGGKQGKFAQKIVKDLNEIESKIKKPELPQIKKKVPIMAGRAKIAKLSPATKGAQAPRNPWPKKSLM